MEKEATTQFKSSHDVYEGLAVNKNKLDLLLNKCISLKSGLILLSEWLYENGQDFLDKQYIQFV